MRNSTILFVFTMTILFISCKPGNDGAAPGNLKCEYLVNPVGIDCRNPRFTWQMNDDSRGAGQTAFRLVVGTDSAAMAEGKSIIWDSGKISSEKNMIVYSGEPLKPFTKYYWSVIVWNQAGKGSSASAVSVFETGMMDFHNWIGNWISDTRDINLKPAPLFRKSFSVTGRVASARLYIAVAGLYEAYINGLKSGNSLLDPAYTRFDRRTLYVTHDVTDKIKQGENAVGIMLGNGWYNHQSTAVWYFHEAPWRARPAFCAELHLAYEDGTSEIIGSNTGWKTSPGPVIFNSIYTGEHYDARLEQPGWNTPGFDDSRWKNAIPVPAPSINITAQVMHPIRITEEIPAREMMKINERTWLFDLGRNISGISGIKVTGQEGTVLKLKHSERLDAQGRADQSNIDVHYRPTDDSDPFQTDIFILSGRGEESFRPRFNYKGFRYVEVTSDRPLSLTRESLKGYFMHSDVPPAGTIKSSNPLINSIWHATNNSYLSNLFGYPTDCPQREKNGWTGDAHIAIETGLYNFDGITVYEKWLSDHLDEQQPNGVLPAIIPTSGWGYTWANGPDWTSTIAIIPWNIYLFYGDSRLLERCYGSIRRYVDHITEISPSGLTDWGLGDWIPIRSVASRELTSSVYYYTDALILSKAARLFGYNDDYEKYSALAQKIRNAINDKFLEREKGIFAKGFQTELAVPLHWGIVPDDMREKVASSLVRSIEMNGNKMDVGLLGTKAILNALSNNDYPDLAYRLASRDTFPSWGWWIKNGATTLYENWPIESKSDISMNHVMFGEIGAWLYKSPGGIHPDENNPGFKNVILRPHFLKGLEFFAAEHDGPFGRIVSSWKRENGKILYRVVIPAGSTATLELKAEEILEEGRDIKENRFIKIAEFEENIISMNLASGTFLFTITE